jgi:hypothetical protein
MTFVENLGPSERPTFDGRIILRLNLKIWNRRHGMNTSGA